jgi:uncharacterized SAM-binding protein YcdF (DUF218 family)
MKKIILVSIFVLSAFAIWVGASLGIYLSSPAQALQKADLLVLLGGDSGTRSLLGAQLFSEGYAPRILLTGLDSGEKDILPYYLHWRSQVLIARGVPQDKILFDKASMNSWQEAEHTLAIMKIKGWKSVLIVSDPPHMRRLNWVWKTTFEKSGLEYSLVASSPSWWNPKRWWSDERSAKFVLSELIKYSYYRLKY